jgi:hypothetical protein
MKKIRCTTGMVLYAILIVLNVLSSSYTLAQDKNCPKIRVGVQIKEVYPQVFDQLNKEYQTERDKSVWLAELNELLMKCLRENSPELYFVDLSANPGADKELWM